MTVKTRVKQERRLAVAEYERREYERTGRDAFEQWQHRTSSVASIHEKINRREEDENSRRWLQEFWQRMPPPELGDYLIRNTVISLEGFEKVVARRRHEERHGWSA